MDVKIAERNDRFKESLLDEMKGWFLWCSPTKAKNNRPQQASIIGLFVAEVTLLNYTASKLKKANKSKVSAGLLSCVSRV